MENTKSHYELKEIQLGLLYKKMEVFSSDLSIEDCVTFKAVQLSVDKLIEGLFDNSYPLSLDIEVKSIGVRFVCFIIKNRIENNRVIKNVIGEFTATDIGYTYHVDVTEISARETGDVVLGEYHYDYTGLGQQYSLKLDEMGYFYWIEEAVMELLKVPELYSKEYSPIYKLKAGFSNYVGDSVTILWSTGYYDGPLSGYCKKNGVVYQFMTIEEKDYSGSRLYGMKKISCYEYCLAYLHRRLWVNSYRHKKVSVILGWIRKSLPIGKVLHRSDSFDGYFEY